MPAMSGLELLPKAKALRPTRRQSARRWRAAPKPPHQADRLCNSPQWNRPTCWTRCLSRHQLAQNKTHTSTSRRWLF